MEVSSNTYGSHDHSRRKTTTAPITKEKQKKEHLNVTSVSSFNPGSNELLINHIINSFST